MPLYKLNGRTYNIPDDMVANFENDNPDATIGYSVGDKKYEIPVSKREGFLKAYPQAVLTGVERTSTVAVPQPQAGQGQAGQPQQQAEREQGAGHSGDGIETVANMKPAAVFTQEQLDSLERAAEQRTASQMQGDTTAQRGRQFREDADQMGSRAAEDEEIVRAKQERLRGQVGNSLEEIEQRLDSTYDAAVERAREAVTPKSGVAKFIHDFFTPKRDLIAVRGVEHDIAREDPEVQALTAAKKYLDDSRSMIEAADHGDESFLKGAARGFGDKFMDLSTWDFGITELENNKALRAALDKADNGEELTDAERSLLDAAAVKTATDMYFGSYLSRGYKAGTVTAESVPFMIEMAANPLATTGKTAASKMLRYAISRFGRRAATSGLGKAGLTAVRGVGDIAGAAGMSATTGSVRVAADAERRQMGDIQFDENIEGDKRAVFSYGGHTKGDDDAWRHAFVGTTIENYSEMMGAYFAPVLGYAGKGVRKGLDKIGLQRVNEFVDNVSGSDIGRLVSDFESRTQWNGTIGEYAEEVAGGIMNALLVGDQTLDTDKRTGVFNLDNNIDTFLGVALMGGFFSAIKTVGYRTPKYRARQAMTARDDAAAAAFGNQERWGEIRNTIAFGSDEDVKAKLADVLNDPELTQEQRAAVLEYAKAAETYKGMLKGESARREEEDPLQVDAETSFDNGYGLDGGQEMNDAKNMLELQRDRVRQFATEAMLAHLDSDPVGTLNKMRNRTFWSAEQMQAAIDYVNAKATYDGMIDRVRDDIDGRISMSDAMIESRRNREDGMIHPATMKTDDRKVYVIGGTLVMNEDGSGIDREASLVANGGDGMVLVRDAVSGDILPASVEDFLSADDAIDAEQEKQTAQEAIRRSQAQEAADKIDGVLPFNEGDSYQILDEQGQGHTVTVVAVAQQQTGQEDGDGEVVVSIDGAEPVSVSREAIQQMFENANLARLRQHEEQRAQQRAQQAAAEEEAARPQYSLNDVLTLRVGDGSVRGSIVAEPNPDGQYEVYTEEPINGRKINLFTREELDGMVVAHMRVAPGEVAADAAGTVAGGEALGETETGETAAINRGAQGQGAAQQTRHMQTAEEAAGIGAADEGRQGADQGAEGHNNAAGESGGAESSQSVSSALERIPVLRDGEGKPILNRRGKPQYLWHEAPVGDTADALTEQAGGDMLTARDVATDMTGKAKADLEKVRKQKPKGDDPIELIESRNAIQQAEQQAQAVVKYWQDVNTEIQRRMREEQARKQAEAEAAKSEQQKAREAEEKRQQEERLNEIERQRLRDAIERDRERRNREYEPLSRARKEMGDDPEALAILDDTEPRDLDEWVSSLLRPHSILWQDASDSEVGLRSELGLKRGDMQRFMTLLGTQESGAKPFGKVVLDIYEGLPDGMKEQYTDQDVRNALLELFNEGSSGRMMNLAKERRIEEARATYQENLRREAEAEMEAWAEAYHLTAEERETFEDFMQEPPTAVEQEVIDQIIADNEQNQSSERMDQQPVSGADAAGTERGQGQVRGETKGTGEVLPSDGTSEGTAAEGGEQAPAGDAVAGGTQGPVAPAEQLKPTDLRDNIKPDSYKLGESLAEREAKELIRSMKELADPSIEMELTPVNWISQFGEDGEVKTPIGDVKMGENQYFKLAQQGRNGKLGMVKPTLENPDIIIEDERPAKDGKQERSYSYVFIKSFVNEDGSRYYHFTSVTVQKQGREVVISAQEKGEKRISTLLQQGKLAWVNPKFSSHPKTRIGESVPLNDSNRPTSTDSQPALLGINSSELSDGKDTENTDTKQGKTKKSSIQGLENYSEEEIADIVRQHFNGLVGDEGVSIVGIKVIGSRVNGNADVDSDLDVLLEYSGDMREDTLFDILNDEENRLYIEGIPVDINPITKYKSGTIAQFLERNKGYRKESDKTQGIGKTSTAEEIAAEEGKVETNPSEAQKEAGNYRKGHIQVDGFDVTIENPKGSTRSGVDGKGNRWETTMHNTYGYIRGTEGVDGDHIDVFLSDNPESGNVYVIDQRNADGSFDEHKVMYGFASEKEAREAYLSNYSKGWQGLGAITEVSREEFKKWVESSHRKTKPFAEYKSVRRGAAVAQQHTQQDGAGENHYTITPAQYTNKKGKTTDMHLVKFDHELTKEEIKAGKELAKASRGWWDSKQGGFMMRDAESAQQLAETLGNEDAVQDA